MKIFRKREYQPWRVQFVLDGILNCLRQQIAQAAHGRPEQECENSPSDLLE